MTALPNALTPPDAAAPEPNSRPIRIPDFDLRKAVSDKPFIGLLRLMTGYRLTYLGATVALGLAALSKTLTFLLLRHLVDVVLPDASQAPMIVVIALGFLIFAAMEGALTFLSGWLTARTAEGVTLRLRNFIFDHVQRLDFRYHDSAQTGDLIQRSTSDVEAIRRLFSEQLIGIGRIIMLFATNWIILLVLDWRLGLYALAALPFMIGLSLYFFPRVSKQYNHFQEQDSALSTVLQENLTGVRVVKAFARQDYERKKFDDANTERFKRGRKLLLMYSWYWPSTDAIFGVQIVIGYLIASAMVLDGQITLGTYLAFAGLLVQIINPMRNLGRLIVQVSEGQVSHARINNILKEIREPLHEGTYTPSGPVKGEITFEGVSFAYTDGQPVLQDISFTCRAGQTVALLGSTGSGKTTLVNLLPRFYEYTSGSVRLDGVELKDYTRAYLRSQIGIVEQEPFLFSRTIRENITYGVGRQVTDAEVEAAARAAAIHDVIMTFPEGYKTMVGERGVTLSGGQKQRVAIARTLLKDPRILILDDATSSVDTETEAVISEALETLMKGRTSFVIAHRIHTVMNADLILVLDKGRIVQRGTHAELLEQGGIYRQIYDVQARIEQELEQEIATA